MQVSAKARYIRMSPKKIRLVLDLIRGLDVEDALRQLQFTNKAAVGPITKLLNSAIANATNNFNLEKSNLFIKEIRADDGPTLKRWKPRAFGRATPIRKRMAHISIVLDEKVASKEIKKKKQEIGAPMKIEDLGKIDKETEKLRNKETKGDELGEVEADKQISKKAEGLKRGVKEGKNLDELRKKQDKGFLKKMFRRKTG